MMFSEKSKWTGKDTAMASPAPFDFSLTLSQAFTTSFWSYSKFLDYFLEDWHQLCFHNLLHSIFKSSGFARLRQIKLTQSSHMTISQLHARWKLYFTLSLSWCISSWNYGNYLHLLWVITFFFSGHEFWLKAEFRNHHFCDVKNKLPWI